MTAIPDPRERALLFIQEAGDLAGLNKDQAYSAADHGAMPTIEMSPHRRMVPTAEWLRILGLLEPAERSAPDVDPHAIAEAVVDGLWQRLVALISQGAGPVAAGPDAAANERGADSPRDSPRYLGPVA